MSFFKRKQIVKSGYKIVFSGKNWKEILNDHPPLPKEVFIDHEDRDEVNYMLGVYLLDPTVKLYVVFNDGSERRIKVGKSRMNRRNLRL